MIEGFERRVLYSLVSSYASQLATTGANIATKLILARLIVPQDLGLYSLALMVLLGGDMLVDLGTSQHVFREKNRPYGNLLILRLMISLALFAGIEFLSPWMKFWGADFPPVMRLMAVVLVIKAVSSVPNVFLDRELLINQTLFPQLARILAMGVFSILLGLAGFGVWALAWGTVASEAAFALLIWRSAYRAIPLEFTLKYTGALVWGSRFLFLIALMGFALQQGDIAILGSLLPASQVGLYTMAFTIVVLVSKVVESAVFRVIYPVFCEYNEDLDSLGKAYRAATLAVYVVEVPIYSFLLFNSESVVSVLLGDKWLPSADLVRALSVFGMINPFSTFGNEVLRATKRDNILTTSTVIGAITLVVTGYVLTSHLGARGMVIAHYIIIGSIPTVATVYRLLRQEFVRLAWQLASVYLSALIVMGGVTVLLPDTPYPRAALAGLLIPVCWYTCYRVYGNGLGRYALRTIAARVETAG